MFSITIIIVILIVPFIVMPRDIRSQKVSPYYAVVRSVIVTMAVVMAMMAAAKMSGHPLYQGYHDYVEKITALVVEGGTYKNMPGIGRLSAADAGTALLAIYELMIKRIPGYVAAASLVVSYFNYIILSRNIGKNQPVQKMPPFRDFNYPQNIFLPMLAMYLGAWLLDRSGSSTGDVLYYSMSYLFDLVFVIQGASVMFTLCYIRKWPKAVAVIVVILFWNVYALRQALLLLGMFDLIFGMKRRLYQRAGMGDGR